MILASGNIVHNLGLIQWKQPDCRVRLGAAVRRGGDGAARRQSPADVLRLADHPDYALAVPTPDHFIPLLYIAGLAGGEGKARPWSRATASARSR